MRPGNVGPEVATNFLQVVAKRPRRLGKVVGIQKTLRDPVRAQFSEELESKSRTEAEATGKARERINGLRETRQRLLTDTEQQRAAPVAGGMETTAKRRAEAGFRQQELCGDLRSGSNQKEMYGLGGYDRCL